MEELAVSGKCVRMEFLDNAKAVLRVVVAVTARTATRKHFVLDVGVIFPVLIDNH